LQQSKACPVALPSALLILLSPVEQLALIPGVRVDYFGEIDTAALDPRSAEMADVARVGCARLAAVGAAVLLIGAAESPSLVGVAVPIVIQTGLADAKPAPRWCTAAPTGSASAPATRRSRS
jgi:hypothetical protein